MMNEKKQNKFCCGEHKFILKPINAECYYQETVVCQFCVNFDRKRKSRSKNRDSCFQGPVFNKDKNFQTHSFVLNSEKAKYMKSSLMEALQDDVRIQKNDEKSYLILPNPNKRNSFCNVCKEHYNDYYQHIKTSSHLIKISATAANQAIKELEKKYQQSEKPKNKQKEPTQTMSEYSNIIVIDEDQDEDRSQPQKRMKRNQSIKIAEQGPPKQNNNNLNGKGLSQPHNIYSTFLGKLADPLMPLHQIPYFGCSPSIMNLNINYNFHLGNRDIGNLYQFSHAPCPEKIHQINISSEKS